MLLFFLLITATDENEERMEILEFECVKSDFLKLNQLKSERSKGKGSASALAQLDTQIEALESSCRKHPYFVATQFHPEYLSRPLKPSPPFKGLILAAKKKLDTYLLTRNLSPIAEITDQIKESCQVSGAGK